MRYANQSLYLLGDTTPTATFGRITRIGSASNRPADVGRFSANDADIRSGTSFGPANDLNGISLQTAARRQQARAIRALIIAMSQGLSAWIRSALLEMRKRREERATYVALAALDARTLKDIGIDRGDIRSVAHGLAYGDRTRVLLSTHRGF